MHQRSATPKSRSRSRERPPRLRTMPFAGEPFAASQHRFAACTRQRCDWRLSRGCGARAAAAPRQNRVAAKASCKASLSQRCAPRPLPPPSWRPRPTRRI